MIRRLGGFMVIFGLVTAGAAVFMYLSADLAQAGRLAVMAILLLLGGLHLSIGKER